jgi:hypothetical protein
MTDEEKGEWAEVADEEPDLRDAAAGPRQVDIDAAQS